MHKNDLNISDLEKYTFSKYSGEIHNNEKFSKMHLFTNNPIIKYGSSNQVNNIKPEKYLNNIIMNNKQSSIHLNNKDINYNQLNIIHYDKSPSKKKFNNINNINILSQNLNQINHNTNYNNLNKMNINNNYKKIAFSKERKFDRRKFRTPDKYLNYNKFNYIDSRTEKRLRLDSTDGKNKNLQMSNKINYNDNISYKYTRKDKKRALTPDNTFYRINRKISNSHINRNNISNPADYKKSINRNNINIINPNSDLYNLKSHNNNISFKDSSLSNYTFNDTNNSNNNNNYNYTSSLKIKNVNNSKYEMKNIQKMTEKILDSNNINSNENKKGEYFNYQDSCFNTRLPRGAKIPNISKLNKYLTQSVVYNNKTPSPIKKSNNYLGSSIYNSKNKKYLKFSRSVSSEPDMKKINNKLKYNYFKLKYLSKDYSPNNSFSKNSKDNSNINSYLDKKYNKVFNNINNSCGNYKSDFYKNNKDKSLSIEKKYNMTQPDFSKSLYNFNSSNSNNINKIIQKDDSIKNLNNNKNNKDLYYKYLNLDSTNYNYQSYIKSYNSNNKEINRNTKDIKTFKTTKNNLEKNIINLNNFTTKLSTNNNTYDENSNNTNSLFFKEKNFKIINTNTIEEVHLNFVNILQNTKNMMEKQENSIKDKIIYNDDNSTTIIIEETEIE